MSGARLLAADLTWTGQRFEEGVAVGVDADGRISFVGPPPPGAEPERLRKRALLPGFVDVHSHAFQIGLRGRGESFPAGRGSFWTWREAMYELVESLTPESVKALSLRTFREMRRAGVTTVGEFHYVHHADVAAKDFALDDSVVEAARESGIRLVLLQSYYVSGGPGKPLEGGQRRFDGVDLDRFGTQLDHLRALLDPSREALGLAPHSLRAASPEEVEALDELAGRNGWPLHVHLEEQRREVDEVSSFHGKRPVASLLDRLGAAGGRSRTGIHLTQTRPEELDMLLKEGWTAGLCPLTEGNLGDGIPSLADATVPVRFALGSDSNLRISMLENLRWVEYGQRLRRESRGMLGERPALDLLRAATAGGADSLAADAGRLRPGAWADVAVVDLGHPALEGATADTLPEALVFGAPDDAIVATAVGGRFDEHRPGS